MQLVALFRLGFPTPTSHQVKLAPPNNSLTHYTKGTQSPVFQQAPTACTHTISGSISLPSPGFFSPFPHGTSSLSVNDEYLALEDGPPIFRQDFSCPALLVVNLVPHVCFRIQGYHLLWPGFPSRFANSRAITRRLFRFRSPLLSESRLISVPPPTEMFQFSGFASPGLWIRPGMTLAGRVSPFGNPRIKACLLAPRGLSQATTSFVACDRQGIHHMHLFA